MLPEFVVAWSLEKARIANFILSRENIKGALPLCLNYLLLLFQFETRKIISIASDIYPRYRNRNDITVN